MTVSLRRSASVPAAAATDSKMRMNPVQRQRLPASAFANLRLAGMRAVREKLRRGHQHARRADAALRAAVMQKRLLQRMKLSFERQSFHSLNLGALGLQHGHKATVHQFAVHAHRAGAALAFAAAFLGPGQMQVLAQHVEQPLHGRNVHRAAFAIHCEADRRPACVRRGLSVGAHGKAGSSTGWLAASPA